MGPPVLAQVRGVREQVLAQQVLEQVVAQQPLEQFREHVWEQVPSQQVWAQVPSEHVVVPLFLEQVLSEKQWNLWPVSVFVFRLFSETLGTL